MQGRTIENAMSAEELHDLQPPMEEMLDNTWRARRWYNEAPWTAASLMVEAAQQSNRFREAFVNKETREKELSSTTIEVDVWRDIIDDECPDVADRLWGLSMSATQGGFAEQKARRYLKS